MSALPFSLVSVLLHTIFEVQLEGNYCIIHRPSPQMYLFHFTSLFSQCYFFFFLNHRDNLIKTAKKPDVSVVKTSSVPVSHGGGLINMKCLFFKTFQSFAFNFHFEIHQSSSKILLLFNIIMFLSKQELIKSIQ